MRSTLGTIAIRPRLEICLEDRLQYELERTLDHAIADSRDGQRELHKCSASIWDGLRFVTRSIPSGANAFPF
jgi:hypothetical protein